MAAQPSRFRRRTCNSARFIRSPGCATSISATEHVHEHAIGKPRVRRSPQPSIAGGAHSPLELRSGSLASGVGGFNGSEDTTSDFDDTGSDTSFFAAGATARH